MIRPAILASFISCVVFAAPRPGILVAPAEGPSGWHHGFSLANGDLWHRRVVLTASADRAVAGEVAAITIADLVGQDAAQLRVCSAEGIEPLFRITGSDGKDIRSGPIPAGARLLVPVELPEKGQTKLYVYLDNPAAWPVPEFLEGKTIARDITVSAGGIEQLPLKIAPQPDWAREEGHLRRVTLRIPNFTSKAMNVLVEADLSSVVARPTLADAMFHRRDGNANDPAGRVGNSAVFETSLPPQSLSTVNLYAKPAGPYTPDVYSGPIKEPVNLIRNPSFEIGLEGWSFPKDAVVLDGGWDGRGGAKFTNTTTNWSGLTQTVPVTANQRYLIGSRVRTKDVTGKITLHIHFANAAGKPTATGSITSLPGALSGDTDWSIVSGSLVTPPDAAKMTVHLTTNCPGTVWYDDVLVAPVVSALVGPLQTRQSENLPDTFVWGVEPIVKVFREDLPPDDFKPALNASAAGNEYEPLQVAVRSRSAHKAVKVILEPLKNAAGATLPAPQIAVVGYVPVDTKTNYYRSEAKAWERRIPSYGGGSDGWAGMWPDPLIPSDTFDLTADSTQPVWLTFKVPANQPAGDYSGKLSFVENGQTIASAPVTFHVYNFALPDQTHVKAIYDLRPGNRWKQDGKTWPQTFTDLSHFMGQRRLCPDRVEPDPVITFENGKAICDFTEYDKAAAIYFNTEGHLHTYTPHVFYGFGWAHPPGKKFGEAPYPGDFPYDSADPAVLRPQYKQAYQACLKAYLDHMREKGWYDRVLLYISDEPHFGSVKKRNSRILAQMKALCDMIHEVDPKLPIYSSTWEHVPEWDGVITAWGIGANGLVPVPMLEKIKQNARALWTVDGHMCLDTPYNAIERLLPWYCFKYGVEGYEFWGANWLTYDPSQFGWHSFIKQADSPGHDYYIRYPNGDGYLMYPSANGPVSSVRLEQAREGIEDYEYLYLLRQRIEAAKKAGRDTSAAQAALDDAMTLVTIPNATGRYSTKILPSPEKVGTFRAKVAQAIEALSPEK